jgi:hypothetical protein
MRVSLMMCVASLAIMSVGLIWLAAKRAPRGVIELGMSVLSCGFGLLVYLTVGTSPVGYLTQALFAIAMIYWLREAFVHIRQLQKPVAGA